jgi:hypothetical protein
MSRGSLLLRAARDGTPLEYAPVQTSVSCTAPRRAAAATAVAVIHAMNEPGASSIATLAARSH